jgi:hypothetical protein
MRNFLFSFFFVFLGTTGVIMTSGHAQFPRDTANGNLIPEPSMASVSNVSHADRTPGFSPITDIEYR